MREATAAARHAKTTGAPPAGGHGDGQRAAGAGVGRRHRPREEREVDQRQVRRLAHPPAGAGAPEHAGHRDRKGLRNRGIIAVLIAWCAAPVRGGGTDGRGSGEYAGGGGRRMAGEYAGEL